MITIIALSDEFGLNVTVADEHVRFETMCEEVFLTEAEIEAITDALIERRKNKRGN